MSNKNTFEKDNEAKSIELALIASQRHETIGSCFSSDDMRSLVNKNMSNNEYNAAIEHLDTCQDCYKLWLDLSLEKQQKDSETLDKQNEILKSAYTLIILIMTRILKHRFKAITIICLILIISLQFINNNIPEIQNLINDSYSIISSFEIKVDDSFKTLQLNGRNEALGFSDSNIDIDLRQAFKAGLISGRDLVLKNKKNNSLIDQYSKYPYNIYLWLGQWCFITQEACIYDFGTISFWNKQKNIIGKLRKKYEGYKDKKSDEFTSINHRLTNIESLLEKTCFNEKQKTQIYTEIKSIIEYLSSEF